MYALQQRRFDNKIIPILYRDCAYDELSWTLSQFQMIEYGEDITECYRKLLPAIEFPVRSRMDVYIAFSVTVYGCNSFS